MKSLLKQKIILAFMLWLIPNVVLGVEMSFEPSNVVSNQSQSFTTTLLLSTNEQSVNAVEGTLLVAKELGDNITISDSGSIITYWVSRPEWDPTSRTIKFSGTVPGGYTGQSGILFSVLLPPHNGGSVSNAVVVGQSNVYLNDGMGTPAQVSTSAFALTSDGSGDVNPEIADQIYIGDLKQDNIPPEPFSPQLAQDERVYDGQWFINFATTDKESGISHYEIQETRSGRLDAGNWKKAQSPYLLQDQQLHSFIYVVAIDRQGNERMIKVSPRKPLTWWQRYNRDITVGAGIVVGLVLIGLYSRRKFKTIN